LLAERDLNTLRARSPRKRLLEERGKGPERKGRNELRSVYSTVEEGIGSTTPVCHRKTP